MRRRSSLPYGETTVLGHCISLFKSIAAVKDIIVVYPPDMSEDELRHQSKISDCILVTGGEKRMDSVLNGLNKVSADYVMVHDAARPSCSAALIERVLSSVFETGAVVPGIKAVSTLKYVDAGKIKSLDRDKVYMIQTPQCFSTDLLRKSYELYKGAEATDSSTIVSAAGFKVNIVPGERENIKITIPEDYCDIKE